MLLFWGQISRRGADAQVPKIPAVALTKVRVSSSCVPCLIIISLDVLHNVRGDFQATFLVDPELRGKLAVIKPHGWESRYKVFAVSRAVNAWLLLPRDKRSKLAIPYSGASKRPLVEVQSE